MPNEQIAFINLDMAKLALTLASHKQLTSSEALVLIGYGSYVDGNLSTAVDRKSVANRLNIKSVDTVSRALCEFEKLGILTSKPRNGRSSIRIFNLTDIQSTNDQSTDIQTTPDQYSDDTRLIISHLYNNNNNSTNAVDSEEVKTGIIEDQKPKVEVDPEDVEEIANLYSRNVKRVDSTRNRGKGHLKKLLTKHSKYDLLESIQNYSLECEETEEKFRRGIGNFFGKERDYEGYLPKNYQSPAEPEPEEESTGLSIEEIEAIEQKIENGE